MSDGRLDPHPGCWNSKRAAIFIARDGFRTTDVFSWGAIKFALTVLKPIHDTSSRECRFDGRAQDRRCDGCLK